MGRPKDILGSKEIDTIGLKLYAGQGMGNLKLLIKVI
jgi:hypothetical protein